MSETIGKIEQLTNANILNPKSMTPRCAELWEWYKTLSPRLITALENRKYIAVAVIADEIDAHAAEIEYQCRI